jgi:succinyl-diaminopimelate desuccinylase
MTLTAEKIESIVGFAQNLVQIPSQGGIDDPATVLKYAHGFGHGLGLPIRTIEKDSKPVALTATIEGAYPGKTWCLNACIDTAPVGDVKAWAKDPFSGAIENNHLHGRGAADSKAAVSIFMHLASDLAKHKANMHGNLMLIFDADEHTGHFAGIKTVIDQDCKPDGIMIGYPGNDKLVIGARGFSRYEIKLNGTGGHTGSGGFPHDNVMLRSSVFVSEIMQNQPVAPKPVEFPLSPKATVTQLHCGKDFTVMPTSADIKIDVRLTPSFNEAAADDYISGLLAAHDEEYKVPEKRRSTFNKIAAEPPFALAEDSILRQAMSASINDTTGAPKTEFICNPSNIGCFLSTFGIEATAGYGLPSKNTHAPNEKADLRAVEEVYDVYKGACERLLRL